MKIKEYSNKNYKIDEIKMTNDAPIKNVMAPLPENYNFFMLLISKPGGGKTTWWVNLIYKKAKKTFYKKFDRVYIFSKSLKTISTKIKLDDDRMFDGVDELESIIEKIKDADDKTLIIIDDCISDLKDTDWMMKLIYNRRHLGGGISIIITTQVYNKLPLNLRKCASDLVLFSTTNKKEIESIYDDYINIPKNDWINLCNYVFKKDNHQVLYYKCDTNLFYHNFNLLKIDL